MGDVFDVDDYSDAHPDEDYIQQILDSYHRGEVSADEISQLLEYTNDQETTMSLVTLAQDCMLPTLWQMSSMLLPVLTVCVTYRVVAYIIQHNDSGTRFNHGDSPSITNVLEDAVVTDNLLEVCDCALGFIAMHSVFGMETLMLIYYAMFTFVLFNISRDMGFNIGHSLSLYTVVHVLLCELYLIPSPEWHKMRGAQMVMSMKVISLAYDIESGAVPLAPNFWAFSSYIFHVGTLVFGPWVSYREHHSRLITPIQILDWSLIKKVAEKVVLMFACLLLSMCVITWVIDDHNYKWLVAYRDAQSFRFSHYFVSYASQLTLLLTTYSTLNSDVSVTRPITIEFPRSLVDVVTNWNIPMHSWLKTYVFKNTRHLGTFSAILLTYTASSLLHGLNFQLSAVLLTLGFYTYIEYVFRNKLSFIFNACIQARACKNDCTHLYKHGNPWVVVTNTAFVALSVFHLAYLGLMFDSSNTSDTGYSMWHTLSKWSNLGYLSHIVAMVTYILYVLI